MSRVQDTITGEVWKTSSPDDFFEAYHSPENLIILEIKPWQVIECDKCKKKEGCNSRVTVFEYLSITEVVS